MTTIIPDQPLPRRTESGMNTRAINAAAGVLLAAMQQGRQTPTGLAIALDSARLLNSPEHAAELERLRAIPSNEQLAAIAARAEAATPGPWCTDDWEIYQGTEYEPGLSMWIGETCRGTSTLEQDRADAEFVAAARTDVPALLARVAELEAQLAEYERPVDEDPIAYTLTDKADGITRRLAPVQALREEPADSRREQRLAQLLDTIRTHGGKWATGSVQAMRRTTGGPVQRGTARRDLAELAQRGHLTQHGAGDGRFYTLRTRKDRA